MADTNFRGPITSMGSLEGDQGGTTAAINPLDGPSIFYQGMAVPDPRFYPFEKDAFAPGRVESFFSSPTFVGVDAIPSTTSTTTVAAAQTPSVTAGVALTLVTTTVGTAAGVTVWATGVPIIPTNTTVPVTVSVIDFGFTTGSTVANSSTVHTVDNTLFTLGQWIVIGGGQAVNAALITQVMSLSSNGTGITISPVAGTTIVHGPIGQGNLFNNDLPPATQFGPAAASANATMPYRRAGMAVMFDPAQGVARNISVTAASIGSGTTALTVAGYDIYGVPMTELITADGTTTVNGLKAFKYVSSIVVTTAATTVTPADVSVGLGSLLGFPVRCDRWEYARIKFNGGVQTVTTGFTGAVTSVANATSGDIRGTQNFSTGLFGSATGSSIVGASFNGVKRAYVELTVPQIRIIGSTPNTSTGLFGVVQA